jgi:glycosyltransferase involved in cell wall biosynthesis
MNILFLSISTAISDINNRGIYPDLFRYIAKQGHNLYIVCPFERRYNIPTKLTQKGNVNIVGVKCLNITKSNIFEKGVSTLLIEIQFKNAINKYFEGIVFDLILYSTPPITFNSLIESLKKKHSAKTYLMLKDIFPQNAVDLSIMKNNGILYRYFRNQEKKLYKISDWIGCMSPENINYIKKHNPELDSTKITLCPNAIEVFERGADYILDIRKKYRIPDDSVVFLFGGNLGIGQGIEFMLKALEANLNQKGVFFVIVGSGNRYFQINKWFEQMAPNNVLLLNSLPRSEYDLLEASCDVGMVFLSNKFTIPNFPSRTLAYLEAKLPLLVCTDEVSDLGYIAEQNKFGKYCLSGDLVKFNQIINFYLSDKLRLKKMGINGYNYLINNYTVEILYKLIFDKVSLLNPDKE